jgi:chloramphenicol-sensitive protein RarD
MNKSNASLSGVSFALLSFSTWGLFPLYWKQLLSVPSEIILAHRIIWGAVFMLAVVVSMGQFRVMLAVLKDPKATLITVAAAVLIALNWWLNIYAAHSGQISEASMGYFITPLFSVLVGLVVFGERLRRLQWLAIAFAATGVIYMISRHDEVPYLALVMAGSFAIYGALKKNVSYPSAVGLSLESWIIMVPALIYLNFFQERIVLNGDYPLKEMIMLTMCGPLTLLPLLLFASAAKRTSLTLIGIIQYVSPTISFLIATLVYHEPLDQGRLTAFICIWCGIIVFATEGAWFNRNRQAAVKPG